MFSQFPQVAVLVLRYQPVDSGALRVQRARSRLGAEQDLAAGALADAEQHRDHAVRVDWWQARRLARGESVIKCPSPLNVLKDTYDRSCY